MASKNAYVNDINPASIKLLTDPKNFSEFMNFFSIDCTEFLGSCSHLQELASRFQAIFKMLQEKKLDGQFLQRTNMHSKLSSVRITPLDENLKLLWDQYMAREEQIRRGFLHEFGSEIPLAIPIPTELIAALSENEKTVYKHFFGLKLANYINFIVGISGLINSMFFCFESQCKILCSLACCSFSLNYSRGGIIQHGEIFSILRKLGQINARETTNCEMCRMETDCKFSFDFGALANIYCYAIKIRMLADYDGLFYENELWEKLKCYFENMRKIVNNQSVVATNCLGGVPT